MPTHPPESRHESKGNLDDATARRPLVRSRRVRVVVGLSLLGVAALAIAGMVRPGWFGPLLSRDADAPAPAVSAPVAVKAGGDGVVHVAGAASASAEATPVLAEATSSPMAAPVAKVRSGRWLDRYVQAVTPAEEASDWPCRSAPGGKQSVPSGSDDCSPALTWSRALFPSAATSLGIALSARVMAVGATASTSTAGTTSSGSGNRAAGGIVAAAVSAVPAAVTAPTITASHPRMILDASTLATLRDRVTANTTEWKALKAVCDSYIGGSVEYPTGNAYPDKPNVGSGYQGEDYLPALLSEAMCYQVLRTTNATQAATYGAKAVDILMK